MGWCHEFGPVVNPGCEHPMVAGHSSCTCDICGFECKGRFGGCEAVWERAQSADLAGRIDPANRDSVIAAQAPIHTSAHPSVNGSIGESDRKLQGADVHTLLEVIDALQAEVRTLRRDLQVSEAEMASLRRASARPAPEPPWPRLPTADASQRLDELRATVAERIRKRISTPRPAAYEDEVASYDGEVATNGHGEAAAP